LESEIPSHSHQLRASGQPGEDPSPASEALARTVGAQLYQTDTVNNLVTLDPSALPPRGGDQPHNNMQPYLTMNFCIALQGVYPPRT
jgi:microcystin-dependent protein